jgi:hypothetical protein
VTIGNFFGCSCVYFVIMFTSSLGGRGVYVQCKHVYHVLQMLMFYGLVKMFIRPYTSSWDEIQRLFQSVLKLLNFCDNTSKSHP